MPRHSPMVDSQGRPTVPYQRLLDELSRRVGSTETSLDSIITIPTPEDYGAVGDGVANDTVALQAFFNNAAKFGRLTENATYLIDADSVTIPGGTSWWGPKSATIRNADVDGVTLELPSDDVELSGFSVNGGNASSTVASGYAANHFGIAVTGTSGDFVTNVRLIDLTVRNCGESGIELFHAYQARIEGCEVSRCGYIGIIIANSRYVWCHGNNNSNIYPGDIPGNVGSNCYGITATRYTASSVYPYAIWIDGNAVDSVTWEGIDEHDGQDIWITNNFITNCGQGIAVQHDEIGYAAKRITVTGNHIVGYGTRVIEGVTYRPTGGIICVGGQPTDVDANGQGQSLTVANNIVRDIGDNRSSPGQSGGIMIRHWRDFKITGNSLFACYRHGIVSDDSTTSRSEFGVIANNVIDGVQTVGGVARDIYVAGFCAALITGNFAAGNGDGINQAGSPTLTSSITGNYVYS